MSGLLIIGRPFQASHVATLNRHNDLALVVDHRSVADDSKVFLSFVQGYPVQAGNLLSEAGECGRGHHTQSLRLPLGKCKRNRRFA